MQMQESTFIESDMIGAPVYHPAYSKAGHIVRAKDLTGAKVFMIGTGKLQPQTVEYVIVWENLTMTECTAGIAQVWLDAAERMSLPRHDDTESLYRSALIYRNDERAKMAADQQRAADAAKAFADTVRPMIPAKAKAVIVAEMVADKSDVMSDYFGSTTTRTIILAFSDHTRDLFPEMRKAALNHPETVFLATAPDNAEHREKWSMGGGYYLKAGYRHDDGWRIVKRSIYGDDPARSIPVGELALTRPAPVDAAPAVTASGQFTVESHLHTKGNFQMWIVIPVERLERPAFDALVTAAKAAGGWYSRAWGKTPGGFAFKDEAKALAFAGQSGPDDEGPGKAPLPVAESVTTGPRPAVADKLRTLADGLQSTIDHAFRDRPTNTPKRQKEADAARLDGQQAERAQQGLRALAAMYDAGIETVPADLLHVRTKAAALDYARSEIDRSRGGYYSAGYCTGKPAKDDASTLAFWALLRPRSDAEKRADLIREKLAEIKRTTIPGYFPTPAAIVGDMMERACLSNGMIILEPEGGSGAILDAIRAAYPNTILTTFEVNSRLRELLTLKGYAVAGHDFTESDLGPIFDAVVMNPPFEAGQDVQHVRKAFDCLKPGGRLVAIMSPSWQHNSARKFAEFREWVDRLDHDVTPIEAGAFKESGTGVATVMLTIRKGE